MEIQNKKHLNNTNLIIILIELVRFVVKNKFSKSMKKEKDPLTSKWPFNIVMWVMI